MDPSSLHSPADIHSDIQQIFISPQHFFLQVEQSQLSHPPSTQLQSLEHFCSPSLYLFQCVPVCLILRSPEMDPALQISLTSLEQRGSFSLTASVALPNAPRRLFAFLSAKAHSLIRFNTLSIRITRTNFAELFLSYFASA